MAQLLGISDTAQTGAVGFSPPAGVGRFGPLAGGFGPAAVRFSPPTDRLSPAADVLGKADAALGPQLAGLLWSEKFRTLVESQLEESRGFERQSNLVLLAGTIPQDSTRAALAKLLRKRWNDGPRALEAAGLTNRVITDPGLLVLIKMFPRKETKTANRPMAGIPSRGIKPAPRPGVPAGGGKAAETAQKKEQAEQDWMAVSSQMVAAWCAQFHAAALAKAKAASGNVAGDAKPKLPADFTLGADAKVIAAYHVLWPDEAPAEVSDQKPSLLEIHYIRAEEINKPKKALGFYARQAQARVADARTIDKAAWLDGLRTNLQTDRRRSVDVLITRLDNSTNDIAKDDEETDLVVEILTIEIKDPAS